MSTAIIYSSMNIFQMLRFYHVTKKTKIFVSTAIRCKVFIYLDCRSERQRHFSGVIFPAVGDLGLCDRLQQTSTAYDNIIQSLRF